MQECLFFFWNKFPINSFHLSVKNNVYVSSDAHTKNKVQKISKFLLENSERIIWEKHNSHHCILSSFCHWHVLSLSVRHKRFRLQWLMQKTLCFFRLQKTCNYLKPFVFLTSMRYFGTKGLSKVTTSKEKKTNSHGSYVPSPISLSQWGGRRLT